VTAPDPLLTAAELGEWLGLKPSTVLDRFERGDLPGFRLFSKRDKAGRPNGAVRFRLSEVEAWLEEQRRGPSPARQHPEPVT
jgi:predicted DNA-binding transcriptional regulator AlpA